MQLIKTTDRAAVGALLALDDYVDVIVPRGGKDLIQRVSSETKINVIKHLDGVCHVYVDDPLTWKWRFRLHLIPNQKNMECVTRWKRCWFTRTLLENFFLT